MILAFRLYVGGLDLRPDPKTCIAQRGAKVRYKTPGYNFWAGEDGSIATLTK